jgi:trans-aconitate methyltransferase
MHWDAQRYVQQHGFIIERGQALVELLDPQPGERVLDVGCGTGDIAAFIEQRGAVVTGIDASAEMIAAARERYPELDFSQHDAAQLDFENEFDAVFSHAALHWVQPPDDAIAGMRLALKTGGRFVAEFGGHRNCAAMEVAFAAALKAAGIDYQSPWFFPRLSDYCMRLEARGFVVRAAWHFELPTPLKGEPGLRNWAWQFLPIWLEPLDAARREAVLGEMEARLRPQIWHDGAWWADYRRLRVVAEAV